MRADIGPFFAGLFFAGLFFAGLFFVGFFFVGFFFVAIGLLLAEPRMVAAGSTKGNRDSPTRAPAARDVRHWSRSMGPRAVVLILLIASACGRVRHDVVDVGPDVGMDAAEDGADTLPPVSDTGIRDSRPRDTLPADTGTIDTSIADTGVDAPLDSGPDTAMPDAGGILRGEDDFESYAIGGVPPSWVEAWTDGGQDFEAGIDLSTSGDNQLYCRNWQPAPLYHSALKHASVVAADIEVLLLTGSVQYMNFALRGQGDSHLGHHAYVLSVWDDWFQIIRSYDSSVSGGSTYGGWTQIARADCPTVCADRNKWIRFRVEGTEIKVKIWRESDAEPAAWTAEVSDAMITGDGWFGPVTYTNYVTRIREMAWATGGATASFAP